MCQLTCSPLLIVASWVALLMYALISVQATQLDLMRLNIFNQTTYPGPSDKPKDLHFLITKLMWRIEELEKKYMATEVRLLQLESCPCTKSCSVNGTNQPHGATWQAGCDYCKCESGEVKCHPVKCPVLNCKHPEFEDGECCPVCKKPCITDNKILQHGETINYHCLQCKCTDGSVLCKHLDKESLCPSLDCPIEDQFTREGECCSLCPGMDFCTLGHDCHPNATCRNLKTSYICECNKGYWGNGRYCSDIDECIRNDGGIEGHKCKQNTKCINLPGTYRCECLPGYETTDGYTCQDVDECAYDQHQCHENALCVNSDGSYECQCLPGYEGDGFLCEQMMHPSSLKSLLITDSPFMDRNVYNSHSSRFVNYASPMMTIITVLLLLFHFRLSH